MAPTTTKNATPVLGIVAMAVRKSVGLIVQRQIVEQPLNSKSPLMQKLLQACSWAIRITTVLVNVDQVDFSNSEDSFGFGVIDQIASQFTLEMKCRLFQ